MTTDPHHGQDVRMATTVDRIADCDLSTGSRDPQLTVRFVNEALPYLNQLNDRARRLTRDAVDTEDLLQETMLRAYVGFHTFSGGTNVRAWLFRIMSDTYINGLRRAQHRPYDYLTDRHPAAHDANTSQGPVSVELDALDALPDIQLVDAPVTLPVFRPAVYYRDAAGLRCRQITEGMAFCESTVMSRLHQGGRRIRALLRSANGRA